MVDLSFPTREQLAFCAGCHQPILGGHRLQGTHVRYGWQHATQLPASPTDIHGAAPLPWTVITL